MAHEHCECPVCRDERHITKATKGLAIYLDGLVEKSPGMTNRHSYIAMSRIIAIGLAGDNLDLAGVLKNLESYLKKFVDDTLTAAGFEDHVGVVFAKEQVKETARRMPADKFE